VVLAIIDTGVKLDHPELSGRIWENSNETLNGIDDDGNGYVDDNLGWDFVNQDNNPTDDHGHGTYMAGNAAANANNNFFYAGVDWNCKLMILKVGAQNNFFSYAHAASAIYYAADHGAHIINLSFGGFSSSSILQQSITYADSMGVVLVACSGNNNSSQLWYPARFAETIAVGSIDKNASRSVPFYGASGTGSNYGPELDLVAPGNSILGLDHLSNSYFFKISGGTSNSTAFVSGVCGLLLAQDSSRTPLQIRQILQQTAMDQIGPPNEDSLGHDIYFGHGAVNAFAALNRQIVSAEELISKNVALSIYPNPFQHRLHLTIPDGASYLQINDLKGSLIFRIEIASGLENFSIELQSLEEGMYLLSVYDIAGHLSITEKIIRRD